MPPILKTLIFALLLLIPLVFLCTFSSIYAQYGGNAPQGDTGGGSVSAADTGGGVGGGGGATGNGNTGEFASGHFDCNDEGGCNQPDEEPPPPLAPGTYQVTGRVWIDLNGDQFWAGEPTAYNRRVVLVGGTGTLNAFTDTAGDYWFSTLRPGTFSVNMFATAGYTNTTPQTVYIGLPPSQTVNFGVKPIPPNIYLPAASCAGPTSRLTIPVDGWVRSTRYDVYREDSAGGGKWFTDIGVNPSLVSLWYSGDPLGRFFIIDDTINPALNYRYFVRSYNNRWTTWDRHPVDSIHNQADLDIIYGNPLQGGTWSGWQRPIPGTTCNAPPPPPNISLTLTTTTPANTCTVTTNPVAPCLPVPARQNDLVTLGWSVSGADTCNAASTASVSPNPNLAYWNGPITITGNPTSGTQNLNTTKVGLFKFNLSCDKTTNGTTVNTTTGIQLDIIKYPSPYFQTTGGDVHSNETIYITP